MFDILVKLPKEKQQAEIAQLVEQRTENPRVRGSSPRLGIPSNPAPCGVFEFSGIFMSWGKIGWIDYSKRT
jgi:hypothetical protein